MSKNSDRANLAALLAASSVPVTKIETGVAALPELSSKDWVTLARSPRRDRINEENRLIEERHEVVDHLGISHFKNGLGEWIS